jgi:hypothetical protein
VALRGQLESSALTVDNTPPAILVRSVTFDGRRTTILFDAVDEDSTILHAEFSVDGQRWLGIFPIDGAADSKREQFRLMLDGELGDRGVVLRATDSMNNVATSHVMRPAHR